MDKIKALAKNKWVLYGGVGIAALLALSYVRGAAGSSSDASTDDGSSSYLTDASNLPVDYSGLNGGAATTDTSSDGTLTGSQLLDASNAQTAAAKSETLAGIGASFASAITGMFSATKLNATSGIVGQLTVDGTPIDFSYNLLGASKAGSGTLVYGDKGTVIGGAVTGTIDTKTGTIGTVGIPGTTVTPTNPTIPTTGTTTGGSSVSPGNPARSNPTPSPKPVVVDTGKR